MALLGWGCTVQPEAAEPAVALLPQLSAEIQQSADDYQKLRSIKGQSAGGEWHEEADRFGGTKHQAMLALGDYANEHIVDKADLIRLMGEPDLIAQSDDEWHLMIRMLPDLEVPVDERSEFWIYYWRAEHDFLFFAVKEDRVLSNGWWQTFE